MGTHCAFFKFQEIASLIQGCVLDQLIVRFIGEHCNLYVPFPQDLWLSQRAGIGRQLKR
uniref:Uncharacterized protein n=1 Tax=Anguilla anguilla TaxID=7936 RepID=A0A0E9RB82_ANGAN